MATLELDFVTKQGENALEEANKFAAGLQLTATVVTEHGPGGGNPIISWEGSEDQLRQLIVRYVPDEQTGGAADRAFIAESIQA